MYKSSFLGIEFLKILSNRVFAKMPKKKPEIGMISLDVPGMIEVTPDLRVAHPSPLKKRREGHLGQKAETKMGEILWSEIELFP